MAMNSREFLTEQATLTNLQEGYGFIFIIHSNDHKPAHIHLYLKSSDVPVENVYTRILIPQTCPLTVDDIGVVPGDRQLNSKEKKIVLSWFNAYQNKALGVTNYVMAVGIWDVFQKQ